MSFSDMHMPKKTKVLDVGRVFFLTTNILCWDIHDEIAGLNEDIRYYSPELRFPRAPFLRRTCRTEKERLYEKMLQDYFSGYYYLTERESIGLFVKSYANFPRNCRFQFGMVDKYQRPIRFSNGEFIKTRSCSFGLFDGFFMVRELIDTELALGNIFRLSCTKIHCFPCDACCIANALVTYEKTPVNDTAINEVDVTEREVGCSSNSDDTGHQTVKIKDSAKKEAADKKRDVGCSTDPDDSDHQNIKNLEKLSRNFKDLYAEGKCCDLTIKVEHREFKVHSVILRARSSVFDAMFSHDFLEKNSGVVPINDCEPDVFEEFLYFVYSGKTQNLSSDNACDLYYLADKYNLEELKEECLHFLKKSLSLETICDVVCLSKKHNEAELLKHAILFFARNMDDILVTNKWQLFLKENPTEANELTIKALKLGYRKIDI